MIDKSAMYDALCNIVGGLFITPNICEWEDGRCLANKNGRYCETGGCCEIRRCQYYKEEKCSAGNPLGCRLWFCSDIYAKYPELDGQLEMLRIVAWYTGLLPTTDLHTSVRKTKEEILYGD